MTTYLYDEQTFDLPAAFQPVALTAGNGHNERWLQERIFELPSLLPMTEMFGHGESFVPLCRELPLRYGSSSVFLDILGVSATGRLVLVECKLWRNPEARREVIAQLFEYASLLSEWTYSDLEARLKKARGLSGENPIFAAVKAVHPERDEGGFVDSVNRSLERSDFLLAIAGDGIRSDLQSLRRLLAAQGGVLSQLALVEIRTYRDAVGRTLLVPSVPFHTEVVQREVLVRPDGVPLERTTTLDEVAPAHESTAQQKAVSASKLQNRAFWDKFIEQVKFDHPDQTPPRHGGNNFVRLDLPGPVQGLVAYREQPWTTGLFVKFLGAEGREALQSLIEDQAALEQEVGQPIRFKINEGQDAERVAGLLSVQFEAQGDGATRPAEQLAWLLRTCNALVNALRLRLGGTGS
ncbi:UNVERIFIED_ORG: hypothetical protein BDU10_6807 [Burkholderia sp. CF145]|uniref:hypothetical protein n=1 Tax=Paraburkholderia hospita TaxID=169430 RepID=UPI000271AD99|nr:hypothetical protein [Paraburkholderia hospita]EUC11587.1 hypothetical protein PMI06_000926 [Burkholderia sp. BT03]SKD07719.1 hypothetical protein SAMN06266956_10141 [Paraburkholderia hospita]